MCVLRPITFEVNFKMMHVQRALSISRKFAYIISFSNVSRNVRLITRSITSQRTDEKFLRVHRIHQTMNGQNTINGVPFYSGSLPPVDEVRDKLSSYVGGQITCTKNEETGLATVCIDHPEKKNAISGKMMVDFENITNDLRAWHSGKAVLLYGAGDIFCSGSDLNYLRKESAPESGYQMAMFMNKVLHEFSDLPLVSVAYISGAGAIGGGAELTLACDYRLFSANPRTRMGFVHGRMGIVPAWDGASKLARIVGKCKALDLLLTCNLLDYDEARQIGLANDVVDDLQSAEAWLLNRIKHDVSVVRAIKAVIVNATTTSPADEVRGDCEQRIFASLWNAPANRLALELKIKHLK